MIKTITICGSIRFIQEIEDLKSVLEQKGFIVFTPTKEGTDKDYSSMSREESADLKQFFIDKHLDRIKKSDAVLIANYTKGNKEDYIGANTFLEIGFAYVLEKRIFILNNIPEQSNTTEIEGMKPVVLKRDLALLS